MPDLVGARQRSPTRTMDGKSGRQFEGLHASMSLSATRSCDQI